MHRSFRFLIPLVVIALFLAAFGPIQSIAQQATPIVGSPEPTQVATEPATPIASTETPTESPTPIPTETETPTATPTGSSWEPWSFVSWDSIDCDAMFSVHYRLSAPMLVYAFLNGAPGSGLSQTITRTLPPGSGSETFAFSIPSGTYDTLYAGMDFQSPPDDFRNFFSGLPQGISITGCLGDSPAPLEPIIEDTGQPVTITIDSASCDRTFSYTLGGSPAALHMGKIDLSVPGFVFDTVVAPSPGTFSGVIGPNAGENLGDPFTLSIEYSNFPLEDVATASADVSGCTSPTPTASPTGTASPSPSVTATIPVTETPSPTQTLTPSPTVSATATSTPTPKPRIFVTPKQVVPGQSVEIAVTNFGSNESVLLRWKIGGKWIPVGTITTNSAGGGATMTSVPTNVSAGANSVRADGDILAQQTNAVIVTIPLPPTVSIVPTRSTVNATVSYSVEHLLPNTDGTITWRRPGGSRVAVGSFTTDNSGSASGSLTVPATNGGSGNSIIFATGSISVTTSFDVAPKIRVTPGAVSPGETVDISLRGYAKHESVRIRWRVNGSWVTLTTVTTSNTGSANVSVTVPSNANAGSNSVRGDGTVFRQQTNAVMLEP